jgi:GxxExxY protein
MHYWVGMTENAVAKEIVDVALRVHRGLGPGLFESVYEAVLASELEKRGLRSLRSGSCPLYLRRRAERGSAPIWW